MDLVNLEKMKVVELRNELQSRGLDTKGVKAVLIERLRASLEGGNVGVAPSPSTPGRRSRRTRSMTKSPSPSPVKKAPEPVLESLEEENFSSSGSVETEANDKELPSQETVNANINENSPLKENSEDTNNSHNAENYKSNEEYQEEAQEEPNKEEQTNGEEAKTHTITEADALNTISENCYVVENAQCIPEDESIKEECKQIENVKKSDDNQDGNLDISFALPKERSRSHSVDHHERRNRSHSHSRSKSRSPRHELKSRSRSRSPHSRSPKHRSGAGNSESSLKEGEDISTPEDEPTIEDNQFGLSWFDSDLHLRIDPVTFTSAKPMSHDIYALVWSGVRTNYGVREGKVCFEVRLSEESNLNRDNPFKDEPHVKGFRVGFSMPTSDLLLGESENSFAYCESGRKATNGIFLDFSKPFQVDDVIGCYLDLENVPCTIKYTLNGEDLGVAFEFDKSILGETQALFPHVLTKGYEYEINLADNDNLLVNLERKIRKRRKIKEVKEDEVKEESQEHDETIDKGENVRDDEKDKTEETKHDESEGVSASRDQIDEAVDAQENKVEKEELGNSEKGKENDESVRDDCQIGENKQETEDLHKFTKGLHKDSTGKNNEGESENEKDDCGPSPSKRIKFETADEDEYEDIHPEPRDQMSLLEGYELIALIPEEQYIAGPQRPESRKDCEVILMVGLPGAGKTTWVLNHIKENPNKRYHVIGADALIAKMTVDGAPRKSIHKGRFDRVYELCFNVLTSLEDIAVKRRRNFILDQANAYASAQRRKMKGFADFKRIAVVCIPNEEELKRRLADKKEKGHAYTLKESTLNTLQAAFTLPSLEFGWFDDIIFTDLDVDGAKEEVKKYNEKGKKALDANHSNRDKRPRRDNYHSDNRRRQDDRRRYDNRNDNRWNDRRAGVGGGGGGYYHGGVGPVGNRWGGSGGYRNNVGGYRDDRGYGGGGGRSYDNRQQRFNSGPQNWVQNNRNRYDDRNNRYGGGGGGGGNGRYDSYVSGGSRDYRNSSSDHRDHRDRNRIGGGGIGGGNNRRDGHRSSGNNNQRDFRHGHRDTREDSRGGSSTSSATEPSSKYKPNSVADGNNGGYNKYNKIPPTSNWSQYQQVEPVDPQQQQYWNYAQGYGNQQWQSMDPQQQQQWMSWWQQQGGAQQPAGSGVSDPNQYWSQYSYNITTDSTKK